MNLSSLSDQDFIALQSGKLREMSEAGFAQLLKTQQAAKPLPLKIAEAQARDAEKLNPVNDMSGPQRVAAGAGKMLSDVGLAVRQAVPGGGVDRAAVDEVKRRDAPLMRTPGGRLGYGISAVGTAVPAMLAPGAGTVLGATAYGGMLGALSPVGTGDSVAQNTLMGLAGGGAAAVGGNMLSRTLQPRLPAGAQNLIDDGVTLTPGMRLGGGFKRFEDAARSIPGVGDAIGSAQRRSFAGFNAAVANRALAPIKAKLPAGLEGREAVEFTERALGNAYEGALRGIKSVKADSEFLNELSSLRKMVQGSPMPDGVKQQFDSVLISQIQGKLQGQSSMTSQTFKQVEGELGRLAARYGGAANPDQQMLGDALQETQAALRRLLERSAGPDYAADIKAANAGWAEFKRMQRASSFLGAEDGIFSPANYMNAVKSMDRSKDKGGFARGSALGQDLAADAVRVMGPKVPDSGTATRTIVQNPIQNLLLAGATSPAAAMYASPQVQRALQILMTGKRPALATKAAAELEAAMPALNALGITGANVYQQTKQK
jgi:hypothetical protein